MECIIHAPVITLSLGYVPTQDSNDCSILSAVAREEANYAEVVLPHSPLRRSGTSSAPTRRALRGATQDWTHSRDRGRGSHRGLSDLRLLRGLLREDTQRLGRVSLAEEHTVRVFRVPVRFGGDLCVRRQSSHGARVLSRLYKHCMDCGYTAGIRRPSDSSGYKICRQYPQRIRYLHLYRPLLYPLLLPTGRLCSHDLLPDRDRACHLAWPTTSQILSQQ